MRCVAKFTNCCAAARWTHCPPPDATANVYAVACRPHGDNVYALANNVGRVYVYRYGRRGDELRHAAIPVAAESRVAIDLLAQDGRLHVIGFGKETGKNNEYYNLRRPGMRHAARALTGRGSPGPSPGSMKKWRAAARR